MKTTRKSLLADKRRLEAQLQAAAGQTRKTLNARVHSAEQENKALKAQLNGLESRHAEDMEKLRKQISDLQGRVKELEGEVKA